MARRKPGTPRDAQYAPVGLARERVSGQCYAKTKSTGQRCRQAAILGGSVCRLHGGRAPQVRRAAAIRIRDLIDPQRVLRECARLAYSDIGDLFTAQGELKTVQHWPEHARRAVSSVEVLKRNLTAGDGEQEDVVKIRLWDKIKPLELLMRHLGLVGEQGADTGGVDWQLLASKMAEIRAILRAAPQLPPAIDITPEPDITPDRPGPEALAQRLKTGGPR